MIGRTLSHYKILSEISRGGMGIVYRALDTKLDREVAIKVLRPELVSDAERRRHFVQEAKAAASTSPLFMRSMKRTASRSSRWSSSKVTS